MGQLLCLSDALSVGGYIRLLEQSGLKLIHQVDASDEATKILDALQAKLGAYVAWQSFTGGTPQQAELLQSAPGIIATLRQLVVEGRLGYWLFVAEKPL